MCPPDTSYSALIARRAPAGQFYVVTAFLRGNGAEAVAAADPDCLFSRDNPLFARLETKL